MFATITAVRTIRALHAALGILLAAALILNVASLLIPASMIHRLVLGYDLDGVAIALGLATTLASAWRLRTTNGKLKADQEASERQSGRDDLTAALARNNFLALLDARLMKARSQQMANKSVSDFALMIVDIDHFKRINDTFGHAVGDHVLKTLVAIASQKSGWTIGRLGGDEFAILADATDYRLLVDNVTFFMKALRDTLLSGHKQKVFDGVSIGIAQAPKDAGSTDALLTCADIALYSAKRGGRNQFSFYDTGMQREQIHGRQIARDLRAAILLDQLSVHYQPIVDRDGETRGAEALVRWRDPLRGIYVPPDQFIPIAEQTRLIDQLGEWVFRRVCRDFDFSGYARIAINVSGAQLLHDELLPMLRRVLRETGQVASNFTLEITETVAVNATPAVLDTVRELKQMGFSLSLDDFGTGNSSFTLLRHLPVDVIKIDKSYIQRLADDPLAQVLVSALARLGEALNFIIVAEGVETEEHHNLALAAGATRFQGYFFGKPAPLPKERPVPLATSAGPDR